ncbi:hypothetical protein [Aeromicrobium camelliae]|nr:hypothetical protein [Aeromicrobium camelliae]
MTVVPELGWPLVEERPMEEELSPEASAPVGWQVPRETTKD